MILEICIDDLPQAMAAQHCGAQRLELCANLAEGGTTPSYGMAALIAAECGLPLCAMLRPRAGHFYYTSHEFIAMQRDLEAMARAGAKGIVFGCLTADGDLQVEQTTMLVNQARTCGLAVTFHRAIDVCAKPLEAIDLLANLGVDNLLSSGQAKTAEAGLEGLRRMVQASAGRMSIMAGSGVHSGNAAVLKSTGIDALHCTARMRLDGPDSFGFGTLWLPDEQKVRALYHAIYESGAHV
jgi:copper homeostasis protein